MSQALIAIAAAELGERDVARQALEKMSDRESFARDPAAYFRRHGATDEIVDSLMGGLRQAQQLVAKGDRMFSLGPPGPRELEEKRKM